MVTKKFWPFGFVIRRRDYAYRSNGDHCCFLATIFFSLGCEKASTRSSVTSFKEIHARDIKMQNPCVNGYAYCIKLKKCIRPFGLVKDGRISEMEQRFNATCNPNATIDIKH